MKGKRSIEESILTRDGNMRKRYLKYLVGFKKGKKTESIIKHKARRLFGSKNDFFETKVARKCFLTSP